MNKLDSLGKDGPRESVTPIETLHKLGNGIGGPSSTKMWRYSAIFQIRDKSTIFKSNSVWESAKGLESLFGRLTLLQRTQRPRRPLMQPRGRQRYINIDDGVLIGAQKNDASEWNKRQTSHKIRRYHVSNSKSVGATLKIFPQVCNTLKAILFPYHFHDLVYICRRYGALIYGTREAAQ